MKVMRAISLLVLLIPISVGFIVGVVLSPIIFGFQAGKEYIEDGINSYSLKKR